jgi:predicted acetyltransferase
MDFDPWKKYEKPWTLNFIYTVKRYRRKGFARKVLLWIKKREETTAFCSNETS